MYRALFPSLFALLSALQLYSCCRSRSLMRMGSKVLLMPLLALCYMHLAKGPSVLVFAGLIFGCFGDLALLWPLRPRAFLMGVCSFFLGHVCYLSYIFLSYEIKCPAGLIAAISVIYLAGSSLVYIKTRPHMQAMLRLPGFLYMLILSALSAVSLLVLISSPSAGRALAFAGATLFLVSDGILSQMLFVKKNEPPFLNFLVMLTYILAQALLTLGWAI